jgi:hypothetical protein
MKRVLFIGSVTPKERQFIESLDRRIADIGASIRYVLLDLNEMPLTDICGRHKMCLGGASLAKLHVPNVKGVCLLDEAELEHVVEQELEIYGVRRYTREQLLIQARRLSVWFYALYKGYRPQCVIRNFIARPPQTIARLVAEKLEIPLVDYQRWAYPNTYQFRKRVWLPFVKSLEVSNEAAQFALKQVEVGEQKYDHRDEQAYCHPRPYILYLSGGMGSGTSIKNSQEWETIGDGWGHDDNRVQAIESALQDRWPELDLLVRQHPYAQRPLCSEDFSRPDQTYRAESYALEDLLNGATGVVCSQTTLVTQALALGKSVAVQGRNEYEGCGLARRVPDLSALAGWVEDLKKGGNVLVDREAFLDRTKSFVKSCVFIPGEYENLDAIEELLPAESRDVVETCKGSVPEWHRTRIVNLFRICGRRLFRRVRLAVNFK